MDTPDNRMLQAKRRGGRPTNEELDRRPAFQAVERVELEPIVGIRCVHCGRAQVPRIIRTDGHKRRIHCSMCAKPMDAIYDSHGRIEMIRKVIVQ